MISSEEIEIITKQLEESKKQLDSMYDHTCCFCGKEHIGYGNDIRPLITIRGNRCCDECNNDIVIPNRILLWKDEEGNSD